MFQKLVQFSLPGEFCARNQYLPRSFYNAVIASYFIDGPNGLVNFTLFSGACRLIKPELIF